MTFSKALAINANNKLECSALQYNHPVQIDQDWLNLMVLEQSNIAQKASNSASMAKILVPHDGTEMSDKAFDKSLELAKAFNSKVIIMNVVDDTFVPPGTTMAFLNDKTSLEEARTSIIKYLKQGAESFLRTRMEKAKNLGIDARFVLAIGSPATEIVNFADSEGIGLIVMGSRQLEKLEKIKGLGSVARNVSENASCPVMIIH